MIHSNRHQYPSYLRLRKTLLLPMAAAFMALSSCNEEPINRAPTVAVTDTQPVGEGLKVIGYALLGAAVVGVLGRMLK